MLTTENTEDTEAATPETDGKASPHIGFYSCATVPAEFARRLERERDESRRVSRKFLKEVLQLIDSQDWKGFMESRETARRLLEGWK